MKKNTILIGALFFTVTFAYAQQGRVGVNTNNPKTTMDVNGKTANMDGSGTVLATDMTGFQAPRLTRAELTNKGNSLYGVDQKGALIYITDVSAGNATSQRINVTAVGYYYFDGNVWVALNGSGTAAPYQEPWNVQGGTTAATTNTQNIYQNGTVAIGKTSAQANVSLDVLGSVRGGLGLSSATVGDFSAAFGNLNTASAENTFATGVANKATAANSSVIAGGNNTASGNGSIAAGNQAVASGIYSVSLGDNTIASGVNSFAIGKGTGSAKVTATGDQSFAGGGNGTTASGAYAFAYGNGATALGNHSIALGGGTVAPARSSITLGRYNVNTFTSADVTLNANGDPIFQLGTGSDNTNRWNTITSFYLANSPGWVAIGQSAANTMPDRSTNNERLRVYGGILSNASFVSDINTVTGTSTDKLVVADAATGQLKTIAASSVSTAYQEPWVVQGGTTPATTNSQAISQNASVAIGKSSAYNNINQAMLDVAGAVRTGSGQTGAVGTGSVAMGSGNTASGNQSVAFGQNTVSSGSQSFAIGNAATASGNGSFAGGYFDTSGASASGQSAFAFGANGTSASANYSFAFGANTKAAGINSFALGQGATASFNHSVAIGLGTIAPVRSGVVLGRYNKYTNTNFTTGSNANNVAGEPLFQLGQGSSDGSGRSNLITGYYGNNTDGSFANGWVVIGANPTNTESIRLGTSERLTVYGNVVASGQYYASTSTVGTSYPDYVFQRYYNGTSDLNNSYKFSNLYDTEKYIIKNNHLPGVTAFADLKTAIDGSKLYSVSELSLQSLEKIEELYLHTIEQQKQIDELKDMIKSQQLQIKQLMEK